MVITSTRWYEHPMQLSINGLAHGIDQMVLQLIEEYHQKTGENYYMVYYQVMDTLGEKYSSRSRLDFRREF